MLPYIAYMDPIGYAMFLPQSKFPPKKIANKKRRACIWPVIQNTPYRDMLFPIKKAHPISNHHKKVRQISGPTIIKFHSGILSGILSDVLF